MAGQVCQQADLGSSSDLQDITEEQWKCLHSAWLSWVHAIESEDFCPLAEPSNDNFVSVIGFRTGNLPGSALQLVDDYYRMPEVGQKSTAYLSNLCR